VQSVAFRDGGRLITAGQDGTVNSWQLPDVKPDRGGVRMMTVSPDGRRAAYAYIVIHDQRPVAGMLFSQSLAAQSFAPAGAPMGPMTQLLTALAVAQAAPSQPGVGSHTELGVEDPQTGKEILHLRHLGGDPLRLTLSGDGKRLAALLYFIDAARPAPRAHGELKVWAVDTGRVELTLPVPMGLWQGIDQMVELQFRPDGRMIVLTFPQGNQRGGPFALRAWDAATGRDAFSASSAAALSQLQFTPDGRYVLAVAGPVGRTPGTIKVWDAGTGQERLTIQGGSIIRGLTTCRDGTRIAAAVPSPANFDLLHLKVWDTDTGEERASFPESVFRAPSDALPNPAFSPDGRFLAAVLANPRPLTFAASPRVKVWDLQTGLLHSTLTGYSGGVAAVAFSPDGRRLAWLCAGKKGREVWLWEVASGRQTLAAVIDRDASSGSFPPTNELALAFSPKGERILVGRTWAGGASSRLIVLDAAPLAAPTPGGPAPRTLPGWGEVVDPDGDCTFAGEDGKLTITLPGTIHDLNPDIFKDGRGGNAPRVL
jgi:WD40 repeat protein